MRLCRHCKVWNLDPHEAKQLHALLAVCPTTSAKVAKRFGLTIQNASNRLRKWERAGFLKREGIEQPSGGIEYVYSKEHP
jgi:predicted transcriptional regulator